jgi:hypothetical protein
MAPARARMWSLFKTQRSGPTAPPRRKRWIRISHTSYPKPQAVRIYQNSLIANATGVLEPDYEYQLRPVEPQRHYPPVRRPQVEDPTEGED